MKKLLPYCTAFFYLMLSSPMTGFSQSGKPVLNHIAVYVTDLKTSTLFYREVVMLDTIPEPFHDGKHTWFSVGPYSHLHLIEGAAGRGTYDKNNHLCFSVVSVEEVIARLEKRGLSYFNWAGEEKVMTTRVDGVKQIYFRDPDGYWIEMNTDYPTKK